MKRTRLKPMSDKRKPQMEAYFERVVSWKAENPQCCRCSRPTEDIHHSRGRIGKLLLDERYWKPLCRSCHRFTHDNPKEARELGLLE